VAYIRFPTTASLLAFPFQPRHVGREVYDAEGGDEYVVVSSGSGSGVLGLLNEGASALSYGSPGSILPDDTVSDGVAATVARSDHRHAITAAVAGAIQPDDAAAEGSASSFARSDHTHSIVAATAGAAAPGDAAAEGAATSFARSDHKHSLAAFGSGSGTFCQGNDSRLSDARTPTAHKTSHQAGGSDAIKLDDLAAPDDNTDLDVSTTAHGLAPKLPNDSAKFLNGTGGYTSPGGIGGLSIWCPDAPPTSPHTCDDEFNAGSVAAKWTELDQGSYVTFSADTTRHMLKAVGTGNGSGRLAVLYQAVPASEFVLYAKVATVYRATAGAIQMGVFVSEDLVGAPTTADFRELSRFSFNSGSGGRSSIWTKWDTQSTTVDRSIGFTYLRLSCNGTSYFADQSPDGLVWDYVTHATLGFTPVHMGISFVVSGSGVEGTGYMEFFRVFSGAGVSPYNATSIGRYL
jgi:hypothetical protein